MPEEFMKASLLLFSKLGDALFSQSIENNCIYIWFSIVHSSWDVFRNINLPEGWYLQLISTDHTKFLESS